MLGNFKKYKWVYKIVRKDAKTIYVKYANRMTIIKTYNTPEECLKSFLCISKEFKEAWTNQWTNQ